MMKRPASIVDWVRMFVSPVLKEGSVAVDATAGRGNDTLFLAQKVGSTGKVYAFDIQEEALTQTKERLQAAELENRVILLKANHCELKTRIQEPVDVIMFNLGYLPGSDRKVITTPQDTVEAMACGLEKLSTTGRMSVVVYTGHPGAAAEARAVAAMAASLEDAYTVNKLSFWNGPLHAPEIYFFSRSGEVL